MPLNVARTRQLLSGFDFKTLFIEELGWDSHHASLDVTVDGRIFRLTAIAQKRGLVAFLYGHRDQRAIPDYPTRRKIERQVANTAPQQLINYTEPSKDGP